MFNKILIANRGEIALRVIRTAREMGIGTVAVYSTADKDSLHVRFADEAVCIGPPSSSDSYLSMVNIISAAEITGVDAIHPGYGFMAENSQFSQLCEDHGIKFIGPKGSVIDAMGDKSTAKDSMKKAGVPVIPGSEGLLDSLEQALEVAEESGYPVLLKATAGGGGKGMRKVFGPEEMEAAWNSARQESAAAFGNDGLYLEKFVEEPRHIEIQIMADQHGNVFHLGERDCSIQRRHQKLVEEAPSPVITEETRNKMGAAAVKAAKYVNYEGAGTVEFLYDKHGNFYFMEMNTRIQVEHPVTEEIYDVDLIAEQIRVAAGETISEYTRVPGKHAMEVRINAEDVFRDFRPNPGKIIYFHKPGGHSVRVDTHAFSSYVIPPYYDSMIGKLIVSAQGREAVINKMSRALEEFIVEGVKTTIPFHKQLMHDEKFKSGDFTTKFLEDFDLKPEEEE
ncbi:MAG: acetyl-CoA carboxylase biotin carboxylase subunit [Bacteroidia bacterium]|nr:acetyl-CoA carboxylase biotin carboxylase subunit [Bacteroidia bacterium]